MYATYCNPIIFNIYPSCSDLFPPNLFLSLSFTFSFSDLGSSGLSILKLKGLFLMHVPQINFQLVVSADPFFPQKQNRSSSSLHESPGGPGIISTAASSTSLQTSVSLSPTLNQNKSFCLSCLSLREGVGLFPLLF